MKFLAILAKFYRYDVQAYHYLEARKRIAELLKAGAASLPRRVK